MENNTCFIEMVAWTCASCGCIMKMSEDFNNQLRKSHNTFWCLNGHSNVYNKKTEIEEVQCKLMNEYAKNAQLEKGIEKLKTKFINRILPVNKIN